MRARVERAGLAERVSVAVADATAVPDEVLPERVDAVTCLNLLHQFPDVETLDRCLAQIAAVRDRFGAAVWILDLVRLRNAETMGNLLAMFEPGMDEAAITNTLESEAAAFTVPGLRERLVAAGLGDLQVATDRMPVVWQAHWAPRADSAPPAADRWVGIELPRKVRVLTRRFRGLPARL